MRAIADGSGFYVGVVNFASTDAKVAVPLSMVNAKWGAQTTVDVRDLWERTVVGSTTGTVDVTIASHDTAVLALLSR